MPPKPLSGLEEVMKKYWEDNGLPCHYDEMPHLAKIVKAHIQELIKQCLYENDSDTHIIAKDLLEKL